MDPPDAGEPPDPPDEDEPPAPTPVATPVATEAPAALMRRIADRETERLLQRGAQIGREL